MRVVLNIAITADGKIALADRKHRSLGTREDWRRMQWIRRQCDAVLIGGATFRALPHALVEDETYLLDQPQRKNLLWNVIVTQSSNLPVDCPAFADRRVRHLVITPEPLKQSLPDHVEIEVVHLVTPQAIIQVLQTRGVQTLLLESGGTINSLFFHAGVVTEYYLTITPSLLAGADSPTPLDGEPFTFAARPQLKLIESTTKGDEVFLHYLVQS